MPKLYVGVDWHKRSSTWVAIDEHRNQVYQRSWECTPAGVEAAIASLPADPTEMQLAVEPVCGWRWMSTLCEATGIDTRIANTIKLRQIAETGQKTDKQDARTLAELLRARTISPKHTRPPRRRPRYGVWCVNGRTSLVSVPPRSAVFTVFVPPAAVILRPNGRCTKPVARPSFDRTRACMSCTRASTS